MVSSLDRHPSEFWVSLSLAFGRGTSALVAWLRDDRSRAPADSAAAEHAILEASAPARLERAGTLLVTAQQAGQSLVCWGDPTYPSLLRSLTDPPLVLWVKGDPGAWSPPCVALVGARNASGPAIEVARQLGRGLAAAGVSVVSGLAYGVDAAAHEGALEVGTTVAVLGSGLDRVYPPRHDVLGTRMVAQGGVLVSEFAPGTPPLRHHFPQRNRIVSGLSLGVVIVEAGETSGALITARAALDQGRDVMVVPGAVAGGRNRGGHALLKDGAALVEGLDDVLTVLRGSPLWVTPARSVAGRVAGKMEAGPGTHRAGLSALPTAWSCGETMDLIEIQRLVGRGPEGVAVLLLDWELAGCIARTPDGRFVRRG